VNPGLTAGWLAAATVWAAASARACWLAGPARRRSAGLRRRAPAAPSPPGSWLARPLDDAGLGGSPQRWAGAWAGLVVAATGAALTAGGPPLAALAAGAAGLGPWLWLRSRRGRGAAAVEAALPPVLEAIARSLRAGASLPMAVAAAASGAPPAVAGDLAGVVAGSSRRGLVASLDRWATERPLPGVRLAAAALALTAEVGGSGARALDGLAVTLRQRQAVAGEVRALATQARLSALVLTVAPVAFAALAVAGDPRTAAVLLRSPVGQVCLALGLALDAAGAAWMARITRAGAS
jgi:tight adherence protein B